MYQMPSNGASQWTCAFYSRLDRLCFVLLLPLAVATRLRPAAPCSCLRALSVCSACPVVGRSYSMQQRAAQHQRLTREWAAPQSAQWYRKRPFYVPLDVVQRSVTPWLWAERCVHVYVCRQTQVML